MTGDITSANKRQSVLKDRLEVTEMLYASFIVSDWRDDGDCDFRCNFLASQHIKNIRKITVAIAVAYCDWTLKLNVTIISYI